MVHPIIVGLRPSGMDTLTGLSSRYRRAVDGIRRQTRQPNSNRIPDGTTGRAVGSLFSVTGRTHCHRD